MLLAFGPRKENDRHSGRTFLGTAFFIDSCIRLAARDADGTAKKREGEGGAGGREEFRQKSRKLMCSFSFSFLTEAGGDRREDEKKDRDGTHAAHEVETTLEQLRIEVRFLKLSHLCLGWASVVPRRTSDKFHASVFTCTTEHRCGAERGYKVILPFIYKSMRWNLSSAISRSESS